MSAGEHKKIVGAGRLDQDHVLVEYSTNVTAVYAIDQLETLTPVEIGTEEDDEGEDDVADEYDKHILQFPQRNVR